MHDVSVATLILVEMAEKIAEGQEIGWQREGFTERAASGLS